MDYSPSSPGSIPLPSFNLKTFINRTSLFKTALLFQREGGGTLSVAGVRQQSYTLSKLTPSPFPKVMNSEKFAASINYFQYMDFEGLRKYTGWKSPKVFFKHYFKSLDALKFHVSAVGRVIPLPFDPANLSYS